MEEEINPYEYAEVDLREYVEVLIRHWWWIVGCALAAAGTAFIVSLSMPPVYEASALVMITEPRYQMQFDPRIQSVEQWRPAYNAIPELATSDAVLGQVVEAYQPSSQAQIEEWKLSTLKGMVEASSGGDPSLVKLEVSCQSPQDSAALANVWAEILGDHGNAIYGESEDDVAFFQNQVAQAEEMLSETEDALIAFRARDKSSTISTQLDSLRQRQADYLAEQRAIDYLVQDISGLYDQLAQQSGDRPPSLGDELTAFLLQVKAFNAQASPGIELQFDSAEFLSHETRGEQGLFLDELMQTLAAKSVEVKEDLTELEPSMLELQRELQVVRAEEQRLVRAQELAQDKYTMLTRKLEEARVAAQEEDSVMRVGSRAAVPQRPVGPSKKRNTALAGVVGLMMGVFGAFAVEWWQGYEKNEA